MPGSGDPPEGARADPRHGLEHYVERAVAGDRRAVEDLLREVRPLVLRYVRVRVERGGATGVCADDLAQDVCLALLEALPGYHGQGRPFLAFVHGIAARRVASARRAAARDPETPVPVVPDEAAGEDPGERVLRGGVAALLEALPEKQREVVLLRVVSGLSTEETAAAVGSTPGAVRVAQRRALARLRSAGRER
ncbi:RNA polymerase sigma factor ShbA [Saccharothrix sp. HUAS TT1]|uniref:RNA polymerase sigma factor ShbA n=1 Tax=unclassified Saccharothrix TaxID=2593673 RepID=UPI00345BA9BD